MSTNLYSKRRKPGHLCAFDFSKTKKADRQKETGYGSAINSITDPWCDCVYFDNCKIVKLLHLGVTRIFNSSPQFLSFLKLQI